MFKFFTRFKIHCLSAKSSFKDTLNFLQTMFSFWKGLKQNLINIQNDTPLNFYNKLS